MNEYLKTVITQEAEASANRMILTSILAFLGCGLTAIFFPSKLFDVAVLFLIGVCFNGGVTCGIFLLAKKLNPLTGKWEMKSVKKFLETPTFCPNCRARESMYPLLSHDKGVANIRKCRKCGYEILLERGDNKE